MPKFKWLHNVDVHTYDKSPRLCCHSEFSTPHAWSVNLVTICHFIVFVDAVRLVNNKKFGYASVLDATSANGCRRVLL